MKNQKHQLEMKDFLANLVGVHSEPRQNQSIVINHMVNDDALILQAPTGTGKTALGYTFLKTHCEENERGVYVVPNKTLVDQVVNQYPEIIPMYGRNEYPCLYYDEKHKADEIPCSMLKDCSHRVDLETGETFDPGVKPCPYLLAKYRSRHSELVACTTAYYFFEVLGTGKLPDVLVIDEAHEWAESIRNIVQYQITDVTLEHFFVLLSSIECFTEARNVRDFADMMTHVIGQHSSGNKGILIDDEDLRGMLKILLKIKRSKIDEKIKKAISNGKLNPIDDREILKSLDDFSGSLYRYVKSFEFALETKERRPLAYVFGSWDKEIEAGKKAKYILTIRSYFIAGLTKNRLLSEKRLSMSATIGESSDIFTKETGITGTFIDLVSDFPIENTKIYLPNDTADLSVKAMRRNDKNKTIRKVVQGVCVGKENGIRSLIIVASEEERLKCTNFAEELGISVVTYNTNVKPREAVNLFRSGQGDVLIGTESQYGRGIDLPGGVAGFIFYLRPGYPIPSNPQTQFEERRLANSRWAVWTWRVVIKMLQARGRTIRSMNDKGCIFLMSQQFKRFTYAGLPTWLKGAYVYTKTYEETLTDAVKLLKK